MITVIGNIKVDESKPERIKYLLACIRSYQFLGEDCRFILSLDNPSSSLYSQVLNEVRKLGHYTLIGETKSIDYGIIYTQLINNFCDTEFVINFMEDQFMVVDDITLLKATLELAKKQKVDVIKASFFRIEQNSTKDRTIGINFPHFGFVYENSLWNFIKYQKYYGTRYYIGVNFITSKEFAKKFWSRNLGKRPHEYEIAKFNEQWEHTVMFPNFELQCAIDDDHGEPGSCLLKRNDCEKWNKIWREIR